MGFGFTPASTILRTMDRARAKGQQLEKYRMLSSHLPQLISQAFAEFKDNHSAEATEIVKEFIEGEFTQAFEEWALKARLGLPTPLQLLREVDV